MPHELINMQATGLRIKNLSTKYGYTRNFLADALNISPNAITHYYSGKHMPTIDNLLILSNLFMLPIEELLILNETASFSYNHFPAYTLHSLGTIYYDLSPTIRDDITKRIMDALFSSTDYSSYIRSQINFAFRSLEKIKSEVYK